MILIKESIWVGVHSKVTPANLIQLAEDLIYYADASDMSLIE